MDSLSDALPDSIVARVSTLIQAVGLAPLFSRTLPSILRARWSLHCEPVTLHFMRTSALGSPRFIIITTRPKISDPSH